MKINIKSFLYITIIISLLNSCILNKKVVYLQDGNINENEIKHPNVTTIYKGDILSISITSDDIESVAPFNYHPANNNGSISSNNLGYTTGTPAMNGFMVDSEGMIDYPVIGKLKVEGLDRTGISNLLQDKISNYVKNPIISIRIMNFKVTVLGDVSKPGTFNIPNERITIIEAIGLAGDLNITGNREKIVVIRNQNEKITKHYVDLTSNDFFNSPVYYLKQNDIIYIEPNRSKINSSIINPSNAGIIISIASLFLTATILISK